MNPLSGENIKLRAMEPSDLDVLYDPVVLKATSVTFGSELSFIIPSVQSFDNLNTQQLVAKLPNILII